MKTTLTEIVMILMVLIFLGVSSTFDKEDEKLELRNYCEMVDLFKSSDGENGWPDYKQIYDTECK